MTKLSGGCHCGAVRYELDVMPAFVALCHCRDCCRHAGAGPVAWASLAEDRLRLTRGTPRTYRSSADGRRQFCPDCGTGLFYTNEAVMPGVVDVQVHTLDEPELVALQLQMQTAEPVAWVPGMLNLTEHERFPLADSP